MTKRHVKVALSGDGGDEVFGGYVKYLRGETNGNGQLPLSGAFRSMLQALPWRPRGVGRFYPKVLRRVETSSNTRATLYGDCPVFRKDLRQLLAREYHAEAQIPEFFAPWETEGTAIRNPLGPGCNHAHRPGNLLERELPGKDRSGQHAGIPGSAGAVSRRNGTRRILPLPSTAKIQNGQLKALLMPLCRRLLPREVWDRPKHGFNVPLDVRLAGAWRPAVEAALDWGERHLDLFDYRYLWRLHQINLREGNISGELWNPFVLLAWAMAHSGKGWQAGARKWFSRWFRSTILVIEGMISLRSCLVCSRIGARPV